ncbi:MAG: hypothetical protein JXA09_01815 [Anaerolineae bacterium]|nr:hypothetical protein [Anaerolineae bacterium]
MKTVFQSSFEEGFYDYQGIGELTCPNGWTPRWVRGPAGGILHRPEYAPKDRHLGHPEVHTGRYAAGFYTVYATHDACLYRKFRVGAGKLVRASAWCMNVTHSAGGRDGGHGMRVGIDPTGGEDHTALSVEYGGWWSSYLPEWRERAWHEVGVETVSEGDVVTLFLHAKCDYAADINASHWDDVKLEVAEGTPVPPLQDARYPSLEQIEEVVRRVFREELERLKRK